MSANNIRTIPTDAFTGLVSLRRLDLSFNQLKKLDNKTNGVLDDCLSLDSVILNIIRSFTLVRPDFIIFMIVFRQINLSHNKFSFITSKTFPSNQWVPYRLREIDLSYNEMPVLTYDLAFGTAKVKTLNISHNVINEIRRSECLQIEGVNFILTFKKIHHLFRRPFAFGPIGDLGFVVQRVKRFEE